MRLLNFISNLLSVRVRSVLVLNYVVRWCCSSRRRLGVDLCPRAFDYIEIVRMLTTCCNCSHYTLELKCLPVALILNKAKNVEKKKLNRTINGISKRKSFMEQDKTLVILCHQLIRKMHYGNNFTHNTSFYSLIRIRLVSALFFQLQIHFHTCHKHPSVERKTPPNGIQREN